MEVWIHWKAKMFIGTVLMLVTLGNGLVDTQGFSNDIDVLEMESETRYGQLRCADPKFVVDECSGHTRTLDRKAKRSKCRSFKCNKKCNRCPSSPNNKQKCQDCCGKCIETTTSLTGDISTIVKISQQTKRSITDTNLNTGIKFNVHTGMGSDCYSKYSKINPYPAATGKSLSECQTMCTNNPECGAILMSKANIESGGSTSCYMVKPNNLFNEGTCTWGSGTYNAYEKEFTVLIYKVHKAMDSSCYSKYTKISPYPAASSKSLSECQTICSDEPKCGAIVMKKSSVESEGTTSCYMIKPNNLFKEGTCTWGNGNYNAYEKKATELTFKIHRSMGGGCYSKYSKIYPYPAAGGKKSLSECQTMCTIEPDCGAVVMAKGSVEAGQTSSCYMVKPNNLFNEGTCTWGSGTYNAYEKEFTVCTADAVTEAACFCASGTSGAGEACAPQQKCNGDGTCQDGRTITFDVCAADAVNSAICFCEGPTSGSGEACTAEQICNMDGTCNDVCITDAMNAPTCFCKGSTIGSGTTCTPEQRCNTDGTCQDVCTANTVNSATCFCKGVTSGAGEACTHEQKCNIDGTCLDVCAADAVNSDVCFCEGPTSGSGRDCTGGQRCNTDGICHDVCAADALNLAACFCEGPTSGSGAVCIAGQRCNKDGICHYVDGVWSEWSELGPCIGICGNATKSRQRTCDNPPPDDGGKFCPGNEKQTENCIHDLCLSGVLSLSSVFVDTPQYGSYPASYCLDGILSTFCHTLEEKYPYAVMEYPTEVLIKKVKIVARNGFADRVKSLIVSVTNTKPTKGELVSGLCEVIVGSSVSNTKSATVSEGYVCPAVINKSNWLGGYSYNDEFAVTQDGTSLVVQRTDSNDGWGMNLAFWCRNEGAEIMGTFTGPASNGQEIIFTSEAGLSGKFVVMQQGYTGYINFAEIEIKVENVENPGLLGQISNINSTTKFISSQGYTDSQNYSDNKTEEWILRAPPGQRVSFSILSMDTEYGYDIIKIFDGVESKANILLTVSGSKLPDNVVSSKEIMKVRFTSDKSINGTGFLATAVAVNKTDPPIFSWIDMSKHKLQISFANGINETMYLDLVPGVEPACILEGSSDSTTILIGLSTSSENCQLWSLDGHVEISMQSIHLQHGTYSSLNRNKQIHSKYSQEKNGKYSIKNGQLKDVKEVLFTNNIINFKHGVSRERRALNEMDKSTNSIKIEIMVQLAYDKGLKEQFKHFGNENDITNRIKKQLKLLFYDTKHFFIKELKVNTTINLLLSDEILFINQNLDVTDSILTEVRKYQKDSNAILVFICKENYESNIKGLTFRSGACREDRYGVAVVAYRENTLLASEVLQHEIQHLVGMDHSEGHIEENLIDSWYNTKGYLCYNNSCSEPPPKPNGVWICDNDNKVCDLKCDLGFTTVYSKIKCENGNWSKDIHEIYCVTSVFLIAGGEENKHDITIYDPKHGNLQCSNPPPQLSSTWAWHATFVHHGTLYLCSGRSTRSMCNSIDSQSNSWKSHVIGSPILPTWGISAVVMENTVYFIGGFFSHVNAFNASLPLSDAPIINEVPNIDFRTSYQCVVKINDESFAIIGGEDSLYVKYNVKDESLTNLAAMGEKRLAHACITVEKNNNNKKWIVVTGGVPVLKDGYRSAPKNTAERYDVSENSWKFLGNLMQERYHHGMIQNERGVMVVGGSSGNGHNFLKTVELLNWDTEEWQQFDPSLKGGRANFGAVVEIPASMFNCKTPLVSGVLSLSSLFEDRPPQPLYYPASNCLDGDLDNFCHTKEEDYPYLMMEYPTEVLIKKVKIVVRKQCCGERVKQLVVSVTNIKPTPGQLVSGAKTMGTYAGPANNAETITFTSEDGLSGKYVVMQQGYTGMINFAEIEITKVENVKNPGCISKPPNKENSDWSCDDELSKCFLNCKTGFISSFTTTTCNEGLWRNINKMECLPSAFLLAGGYGGDNKIQLYHPSMAILECNYELPQNLGLAEGHSEFTYDFILNVFSYDRTIYFCGGSSCSSFDSENRRWKTTHVIEKKPQRSIVMKNVVYFMMDAVWKTTLPLSDKPEFTQVSLSPSKPFPTLGHCNIKIDENNFVITGGHTSDQITSVWNFNVEYENITSLASLNHKRYNHGCTLIEKGGKQWIFVAGGGWNQNIYTTVERLDISSWDNTWESIGELNEGRHGLAMMTTERGVMVVGGHACCHYNPVNVELYDWQNDEWNILEPSANLKIGTWEFGGALEIPASFFGCETEPLTVSGCTGEYEYNKAYIGGVVTTVSELETCHSVCQDDAKCVKWTRTKENKCYIIKTSNSSDILQDQTGSISGLKNSCKPKCYLILGDEEDAHTSSEYCPLKNSETGCKKIIYMEPGEFHEGDELLVCYQIGEDSECEPIALQHAHLICNPEPGIVVLQTAQYLAKQPRYVTHLGPTFYWW